MEDLMVVYHYFFEKKELLLENHYFFTCLCLFLLNFSFFFYYFIQLGTREECKKGVWHIMRLGIPIAASFSRKSFQVDPVLGTFLTKNGKEKEEERLKGADPSSAPLGGLSQNSLLIQFFVFVSLLYLVFLIQNLFLQISFHFLELYFLVGSLIFFQIVFLIDGLVWNRAFLLRISTYNQELLGVPPSVEFSWDFFRIEPREGSLSFNPIPTKPKKEANVMTNAQGTSSPPG